MKMEEKLLRAIGGVDDDLIADAMEPHKRKKPAWLRWTAAAACLCLLLASPVGAAMGESLYKFMNGHGTIEHCVLDRIALDSLSREALEAFPNETGAISYILMDSIADSEKFLGIDLPDNPILESAIWSDVHLGRDNGQNLDSHCIVQLLTGDKPEPYCVDTSAAYCVSGITVDVMYRRPTELNPYENGGGVSFEQDGYDAEDYTTANGRTWDLYIRTYGDGTRSVQALGNVGGTLAWVQFWHTSKYLTRAYVRDLMIEILEAYE